MGFSEEQSLRGANHSVDVGRAMEYAMKPAPAAAAPK